MDSNDVDTFLTGMRDELSSIEHERWSHWQRYMHSKGVLQPDGSLVLPANLVVQWTDQMNKSFADLSDKEKDSDREQVDRYLPFIAKQLKRHFTS